MLKHAQEHTLDNTGEVGFVKIVYTERVQDGVERLGYAVGLKSAKGSAGPRKFALESLRSPNVTH